MKKFYLFSVRGMTDKFFCGNIYEKYPSDEIVFNGVKMSFEDCLEANFCMVFDTLKLANTCSINEETAMNDSNNYANRAMECEEIYGCEGVDDMRFEF